MTQDMRPFDLGGPLPTGLTVIEASAGTGKTWAIAALTVRYLAEGLVTAPHLLAVTFTHLASADLRSRLYQRLVEVAEGVAKQLAGQATPTDQLTLLIGDGPAEAVRDRLARLQAAIADFDGATVATIHEFCRRTTDWLGPLTGTPPTRIDDEACAELAEQTVADVTLARLLGGATNPNAETCRTLGRAALFNPELPIVPGDDEAGRFAEACRQEYAKRKAAQGISDFPDLALRLDAALHDPRTGSAVAQALADRYHVILVDEFQDTDPVQWSILRAAFADSRPLVLVGDPKQSIYGFRGADVYAYLEAVTHAADTFTLPINYRSDRLVVEAVNHVFAGVDFGQTLAPIPMRTSTAEHTTPRLTIESAALSGLQIRRLPGSNFDQRMGVPKDLVSWVADTLARRPRLQGPDGRWRPLRADDIAVLVSSNKFGQSLSSSLHDAGVPAVFSGVASVFASAAADEWLLLLDALAHPRPATLRRAMAGRLVGLSLAQLADATGEATALWSARLREWSGRRLAPAAVLDRLTALTELPARLLSLPDGERLLTDVSHLSELLSSQARFQDDPADLHVWLRTQRDRATRSGSGDRTRRLETDRPAVSVLTIHAAKGLEFPVVLVPAAADAARHTWGSPDYPMLWRQDGHRVLDTRLGGFGQETRRRAWAEEAAAEDRRRLYVALTRASMLTVAWLGDRQATLTQLVGGWTPDKAPEGVELVAVKAPSEKSPAAVPPHLPILDINVFGRQIDAEWVRSSYSGLTAGLHDAVTAVDLDEPDDAMPVPLVANQSGQLSPMDGLPAGTAFGTVVHGVLEACDPASPNLPAELAAAVTRLRASSTLPDLDAGSLASALQLVLTTPLGPLAAGATLADIPVGRRQTELNFEMPMGQRSAAITHCDALATLFDDQRFVPTGDPLAGYGAELNRTAAADRALRGFLTGSIDLVAQLPNGQVLLADYKTNKLGRYDQPNLVTNYDQAAMAAAMRANHYPLQALLYAVALRRYLNWRRPQVPFDAQWAGVAYLFVRGMAGPQTPLSGDTACGVFAWRPSVAMIEQADAILSGGTA